MWALLSFSIKDQFTTRVAKKISEGGTPQYYKWLQEKKNVITQWTCSCTCIIPYDQHIW